MLFRNKPSLTPEQEIKKVKGFIKYIEDAYQDGNEEPLTILRKKLNLLGNEELGFDCYMKNGYNLEFYVSGEPDYASLNYLSKDSKELIFDILLTFSQS